VARQWTLYGEIDFDFGDWADPRRCGDGDSSDVRITFQEQGNWAMVGVDNREARGPAMSLQSLRDATPELMNSGTSDIEILHEFGHILGFVHTWTVTSAACDEELDWDYVYKYLQETSQWTKEQVDFNLRSVPEDSTTNVTGSFDRNSVMNYTLPENFFKKGRESRCFLAPLNELSLKDKRFILSINSLVFEWGAVPPLAERRRANRRRRSADATASSANEPGRHEIPEPARRPAPDRACGNVWAVVDRTFWCAGALQRLKRLGESDLRKNG